jgi:hypothetical protein
VGLTILALEREVMEVEPIVIVNGSTDCTADTARYYGATVLESPEGKMPAIQEGLRYLGKRALDQVLILDADTRPLTRHWSSHMYDELTNLPSDSPAMVWGPYAYKADINPLLAGFFTATTARVSWADRHKDKPRTIRGGNTGLYIKKAELLEEIMSLSNYWPREDVAIFDLMKANDTMHTVTFNPNGWALTSGYRIKDTIKRNVKDRQHRSLVTDNSYADDAPKDSKPYNSETTATVRHNVGQVESHNAKYFP